MLIKEVADPVGTKLLALASFLKGRATDTGAKMEYPTAGFINLAHNLGIEITSQQLQQMIAQPPLDAIFNPMEPNSPNLTFKTGKEQPTEMPVDQAEKIVAKAAKSAMKRDR